MKIYNILLIASLVIRLLLSGNVASAAVNTEESKIIDKVETVFNGGVCNGDVVDKYPDCRDGVKILEEILHREPGNIRASSLILKGYVNVDREKGMETAKRLLKLDPQNGEAYAFLGRFIGTPEERIAYLRKAAQYLPNDRYVHGNLAFTLVALKRKQNTPKTNITEENVKEAVSEIKKQIVVNPMYESILVVPGVLWKMGKENESKDIYTTYLTIAPLSQAAKCQEFTQSGLPNFVNDQVMLNIYKEQCGGFAYYEFAKREKNPKEQVLLLRKAIDLTPDHYLAHGELAKMLLEYEGDIDGAVREMKQQIKQFAGHASYYVVPFGQMLVKNNHRDEAVEIYEDFLRSYANNKDTCEAFKALDLSSYSNYKKFLTLLKSTCK